MNHWMVFDQLTAAAVRSQTGNQVELRRAEDTPAGSVIALAAAAPGPAAAVIPAADGERAVLLRFTHNVRPQTEAAPSLAPTRVAPGGFLGLADELVLEDEPEPPKKWWQKILD